MPIGLSTRNFSYHFTEDIEFHDMLWQKNSGLFENEVNGLWSRLLVTDDENRSWILGTSSSKADYLHQAKNTKMSRCLRTYSVLPSAFQQQIDLVCLSCQVHI